MDYLIDLKKQDLSGKTALEGGISLGVDTDGNIKKIDESGAISDIGGSVDESRLLPALDSVPVDRSGNPVVFKAVSAGMDKHTLLYCPFDADFNDHSSYARTVTHDTSRAGLSISLERNKFGTGSLQGTGYTTAGAVYVLMSTPIGAVDFTIHKWIYVTSAADRFGIFSTYGEAGSGTGTPGYGVDGLACWIDTDGTLKLYKASAHFSSYWYDDDSGNKLAEAAMPSDYLNRWVHIAVARSGNIWMLFADGSLLNSNSKEFNATQPYLRIGSADSKATAYGNIDEFIVLDYAKWTTDFEPPTQPASEVTKSYEVSDKGAGTVDESRLLPENPANGDIPCFDATATVGGGNDANTRILLHFDADEIKDEAAGNAAPVTITKKTGTITVVEGGKWGKCAKYVTGSMTVATNLDELNANNWVVSGWFNPDGTNHGVSYPAWLSMDDSSTNGFFFDSTGRYGESDGPLFYLDTPPAAGTWHWLAIVKYSGGLRFYLNGAFLNEISAQQRANFCSTLAIGGFAGTYAAGSTERTFSGLVDEVRLQYIPDDEITQWTGTSIAVPDAPYSKPQTVGEWGKFNKAELAMKSELTAALTGKVNQSELAAYQKKSGAFSGQYSDLAGKPSTFPPAAHTHTIANVTDLQATVNKAHEHANKAALDKISETGGKLAYGGTAVGGVSSWTELADKPSTFPPAAHSHTIANVTDLQTMLNSKAASAHGHAVADVTGLQSLLDGKAAVGHTHAAADVTGLATALAGKVSSVNGLTPDDSGALVLPQATSGAAGLMAAADKAAIAGLTALGIYPVARSKTGAVDFNEVIDHGFYFIEGDSPHLNYPETHKQSGGTLQVIRAGAYLTQTFIPIVSQSMAFIRHCINVPSDLSGRTFSTWRRLLTDADITESKTRPGYFKLPGGMIVQWGAATITGDGLYQVTFPIVFPNAIFIGNATAVSGTASASGVVISILEPQTNRMTLITKNHPGSDQDINVHWLAIGY